LFIDCAAFGKTGQTIGESLTKGRPIHIEGRLKFEQWEQEDGQRRSKIRVVVEQFRFVDRKPGRPASQPNASGRGKRRSNRQERRACGRGSGDSRSSPIEPTCLIQSNNQERKSVL
jgi:single-strand DNA-binding protein